MKKLFLFLFVLCHFSIYGQDLITSENFEFKFIKAKIARGSNYFYVIKTPDNHYKIQVRFKLNSTSSKKEDFDPNKFYLVSDKEKVRIRPIDVRYNYGVGIIYVGFDFLTNYQTTDKNLKQWIRYDPQIKDTFYDYDIDGYENVYYTINFGTKRKPKMVTPYLAHEDLKSCKMDIYFSVPENSIKKAKIYYGNKLIANIKIK